MLRKFTFFTLVLATVLVISCKKNEPKSIAEETVDFFEFDVSTNWEMGYVLRVNSGLYTIEEDTGSDTDKMKWVASLNLGDRIMIGEPRKAVFTGDNRVYEITEIRDTYGREGYAINYQIASGGTLAVITDDRANLYKTPNPVDVTGFLLSRKTVIVYYPETESNGFVEIRAYDPEARANRHGNYVRLTSLSEKPSDVQSSILLQTALPLSDTNTTQKARKDALLESALLDYPDSVFYHDIYDVANPAPGQAAQEDNSYSSDDQ